MNVLILGYGKMGRTIEEILINRGHFVTKADNKQERDKIDSSAIEVAIEFSQPDAAFENIEYCLNNNIKVVSGTTGWLDKFDEAQKLCDLNGGTMFYASNYSIGVNIFFRLNKWLANKMAGYPDYSISIKEIHHTEKIDAPSGTAITLAEGIISYNKKYTGWTQNKSDGGLINIESERTGNAPGTHTITYKSEIDTLLIEHEAHSRKGFALGAVLVSEWINDKKGVLSMDDFFDI